MNIERLKRATAKDNLKVMARMALSDATGLDEETTRRILEIVGSAYILADEGEEPDYQKLKEYLQHIIFAEESQRYYNSL